MSKQTLYDKVDLLGVDIDVITNQEAITYCLQKAKPGNPSCYVVKPYVEFLDRAAGNESLRELLNASELTLPDGIALVWATAFLYAGRRTFIRFWLTLFQIIVSPDSLRWPLTDRTSGINFTKPLLQAAAEAHLKVFLIGDPANTEPGHTIASTGAFISNHIPSLMVVGTFSGRDHAMPKGQVSSQWYAQVQEKVRSTSPDLILVGMGFPLQEHVCARLVAEASHGVYIGEGGTFDYAEFGGTLQKAPPLMQKLGLEWLWRLALEPSRLTRQLAIPRFIYRVWQSRR
jgi:N-acetylglucosaminyldiphosphoundecaprenol N-acetyl-beta-D-mannosaminyltransferase